MFRVAIVVGGVLLWIAGETIACALGDGQVGKCVGARVGDMLAALFVLGALVVAAWLGLAVGRATNRTWAGWLMALVGAAAVVAFVVWTDIGPKDIGEGSGDDASGLRR